MTLEILINMILTVFFSICLYLSTLLEDPGLDPLGAKKWPQVILVLLIALLISNIVQLYKKQKKDGESHSLKSVDFKGFFKSKLLIGMVMLVPIPFMLDFIGFIPTILMFLAGYMVLLGERKPVKIAIVSLVTTFVIFFIFSSGLSIMLPRGTGVFREFHMFLENIKILSNMKGVLSICFQF